MGENSEQAKSLLRRRMQTLRSALPADTIALRSAEVAARVLALSVVDAARDVVAYLPTDNEIDPAGVVHAARARGKRVYYPRVGGAGLEFVAPEAGGCRPGYRGILEPVDGEPLVPGREGVLFLVPGVAFDLRGVRLGRGGGHYDRALLSHGGATHLGLAYDFQVVQHLPEAAWDVRMHAIVTETRLVGCAEGWIGQ
jgi:5-formyltetrahydrofolate cyclo-ligase